MSVVKGFSVTGLDEIQRGATAVATEAPAAVRVALSRAANVAIVDVASRRVPVRSGRARSTLAVVGTQKETRIVAGGSRAEYYGWLDFGGRVGRNKSVLRNYSRKGRYLWPAIAGAREELAKAAEAAVVDLAKAKGLEVT